MTTESKDADRAGEVPALPGQRKPGQTLETGVKALDEWNDSMGDPQRDTRRIELANLPPEVREKLEALPGERGKTVGFKSCTKCGEPVFLNLAIARWVGENDGRIPQLVRHHDCQKPHEFPKEGILVGMGRE